MITGFKRDVFGVGGNLPLPFQLAEDPFGVLPYEPLRLPEGDMNRIGNQNLSSRSDTEFDGSGGGMPAKNHLTHGIDMNHFNRHAYI